MPLYQALTVSRFVRVTFSFQTPSPTRNCNLAHASDGFSVESVAANFSCRNDDVYSSPQIVPNFRSVLRSYVSRFQPVRKMIKAKLVLAFCSLLSACASASLPPAPAPPIVAADNGQEPVRNHSIAASSSRNAHTSTGAPSLSASYIPTSPQTTSDAA